MKAKDIKIGGVYTAKVTNREVSLRIDEEHPGGGWTATNLATGKPVRVKTAARLRRKVTKEELKSGMAPGMDKSPIRRSRRAAPVRETPEPEQPSRTPTRRPQRAKVAKLSGLDAAYEVLRESDEPLTAQEIVDAAAERGYWRSDAATPQATIHAAISREIKKKGGDARFVKVGRGKFVVKCEAMRKSG